ncbi:protein N-lysine methyltransferase METTL21A [Lingula anatina]|uniref:Protein N-lysine methyltransferase METTL21A n=1 Tax=Lingula anatina TaxID=7574 RepID=A0A1S3HC20_LINAN|nr:protein N-lysine methyltransferase METTL21A [Lingula anatina]|eukprot:XP_013383563.1 protein N-lysine methyltransferase METTL21A [Lingula anatina]
MSLEKTDTSTCAGGEGGCTAVMLYDETKVPHFHKDRREFKFGETHLFIRQNWSQGGVAAVVWDAAVVLAEYLDKNPDVVKGKLVLELGAGTGLAGIAAAMLGGHLTLTDRAMALEYIQENVELNIKSLKTVPKVTELDWGKNLFQFSDPFDVILGADIIYIEDTFQDLLETLKHLCNRNCLVLLSCKIRYDRDSRFLSMMKEFFHINDIYYDSNKDVHIYEACKQ